MSCMLQRDSLYVYMLEHRLIRMHAYNSSMHVSGCGTVDKLAKDPSESRHCIVSGVSCGRRRWLTRNTPILLL